MASIDWKYPIEAMHGALKKKVFGAAKRSTANAKGGQPNFSVNYGKRTTSYTTAETAQHIKFGAISKLVAARRANPTKRNQDLAGFKAQSDYKTLNQYIFAQAAAEYAQAQTQS